MHTRKRIHLFLITMVTGIMLGGCTPEQINMTTQTIGMVTAPQAQAQGQTGAYGGIEYKTDRYGSDYNSFEIQANPVACQTTCKNDTRCRAWTYVKPGVQASNAMCHLKNTVPNATSCEYCTSGVVR